jgi:hypothetical protein
MSQMPSGEYVAFLAECRVMGERAAREMRARMTPEEAANDEYWSEATSRQLAELAKPREERRSIEAIRADHDEAIASPARAEYIKRRAEEIRQERAGEVAEPPIRAPATTCADATDDGARLYLSGLCYSAAEFLLTGALAENWSMAREMVVNGLADQIRAAVAGTPPRHILRTSVSREEWRAWVEENVKEAALHPSYAEALKALDAAVLAAFWPTLPEPSKA